jgi:hypothetical protein
VRKSRGQAPKGPAAASLLSRGQTPTGPAAASSFSRGLAACLALIVASACAHAPAADPGRALGERFSLRVAESARIRGEHATIVFERIVSDSRCGVDVQCIRAGEARAAFRLETGGAAEISFELDTDRERTREVGGYRVTLVDVSPAPRSTVRIAATGYRAEISVSR